MTNNQDKSAEIILMLTTLPGGNRVYALARVTGVPVNVVRDILSAQETRHVQGGKYGYRAETRRRDFFEVDDDGVIWMHHGLVPRLERELSRRGWAVDSRKHPHFCAIRGQFVVDSYATALECIEDAEREADVRMLIVTRNAKDTRLLQRALKRRKKREEEKEKEKGQAVKSRRIVTQDPFQKWPGKLVTAIVGTDYFRRLDPALWTVVMFFGTEPLLSRQVQESMDKYLMLSEDACFPFSSRLFCIHTGAPLSRLEEIMVEQACGPVEIDGRCVPDDSQPVNVVVIEYQPTGTVAKDESSALERKRSRIWRNDQRNQLIADVITGIKAGDPAVIEGIGIPGLSADSKVAILVESPEHGRELAARLPDWRLLCLKEDAQGVVPGDIVNDQCIATELYVTENECLADIIVRATGGRHPLVWDMNEREAARQELNLGLIDFAETDNNGIDRDARARIADYQRHNQRVTSTDYRSWKSEELSDER